MHYNKLNKIEIISSSLLLIILVIVCFVINANNIKTNDLELKIQELQIELNNTKTELNNTKTDLNNTKTNFDYLNLKVQNLKISLVKDIFSINHLNDEQRILILTEIWDQSKKYKINPAFLYAILWKESTFRNDVEHTPTYVRALKKEIQALGMGAIVWEFWDKKLIANTSLKSKNDLKDWKKNIEATAYILSYLKSLPNISEAKNKYESAASRYYGKYQANYVNKTITKFMELVS